MSERSMRTTRKVVALIVAMLALAGCTNGNASSEVPGASVAISRNGEIPAFSNPTEITNPYLPFARGGRWIYEGTKDGEPYLIEVAVTSDTRTIDWNGNSTETMVMRHRGWVNGVLTEEAFDYVAQGTDGGVWYFGEDVSNFDPKNGSLLDHEGSWLAGADGALPALLMPRDPQVGQVFYSEDIAKLDIVERDEILSLTEPAQTPTGPVATGLLLGATQPDGTQEQKVFVPGVGEVLARSGEGEVRLVRRLPDEAESATAATFSAPTVVDNPYFGAAGVDYRLYLGEDGGEPLRIEVAPTGETKAIAWEGGTTDTVVSQFTATSDRHLLEIAVDWFAQDDNGNVWYFGENVWNYEEGRIANTDGTWIAGADGPPGLILPGDPTRGQRFNPENIPGFVFETVDVQAVDATYEHPTAGRLDGVMVLHETLNTGAEEIKHYAMGYGNVRVEEPGIELVDIVYALPNDAIDAPLPRNLQAVHAELRTISLRGTGSIDRLRRPFDDFTARGDAVPPVLIELAREQLDALEIALGRGDGAEARMTALDLEQTVLDVARLYRTERHIDVEVLDLLARRMLAAVDAGDLVTASTAAALARGISERDVPGLRSDAITAAAAADAAADQRDLAAIGDAAAGLRAALR